MFNLMAKSNYMLVFNIAVLQPVFQESLGLSSAVFESPGTKF